MPVREPEPPAWQVEVVRGWLRALVQVMREEPETLAEFVRLIDEGRAGWISRRSTTTS